MNGRLVVDLGSTSLTWRVDGLHGQFSHHHSPAIRMLQELSGLPRFPELAVVGSVAHPQITAELTDALDSSGINVIQLHATSSCLGVINGYERPAQLGIDRWAAIIAAFHVGGGPLAVADCGTATTFDWVDQTGRHKGGAIGPGLRLMREGLTRGTRLEWTPRQDDPEGLGQDTVTAIEIGLRLAAAGMINELSSRCRLFGGHPHQWITGGESAFVVPYLEGNWRVVPDLVLDGLELIADCSP